MKKAQFLLVIFLLAGLPGKPEPQTISDQLKSDLVLAEKKMFDGFAAGDVETFLAISGDDYITINADGAYLNKTEAAKLVPGFKGAASKYSEKKIRFYNDIAIITGRAKYYMKSILVADIYFTQTWVLRDNKWLFIGWQGTMTGQPKYYPVYITVLFSLILFAIIVFIKRKFSNARKKKLSTI